MAVTVNKKLFPDELMQEYLSSFGDKKKMIEVMGRIRDIADKECQRLLKEMGATDEEIELSKKLDADSIPFNTTNEELLQLIRDSKEKIRAL